MSPVFHSCGSRSGLPLPLLQRTFPCAERDVIVIVIIIYICAVVIVPQVVVAMVTTAGRIVASPHDIRTSMSPALAQSLFRYHHHSLESSPTVVSHKRIPSRESHKLVALRVTCHFPPVMDLNVYVPPEFIC